MDDCNYCIVRHLYYEAWRNDRLIHKRMKEFKCPFRSRCRRALLLSTARGADAS